MVCAHMHVHSQDYMLGHKTHMSVRAHMCNGVRTCMLTHYCIQPLKYSLVIVRFPSCTATIAGTVVVDIAFSTADDFFMAYSG